MRRSSASGSSRPRPRGSSRSSPPRSAAPRARPIRPSARERGARRIGPARTIAVQRDPAPCACQARRAAARSAQPCMLLARLFCR
ncbi:hypothetical protein EGT47_22345 [Burkholderia cenocepacia]|nr:hypothetical protein EGT47_22345 [Burkholderia cenocepacia]